MLEIVRILQPSMSCHIQGFCTSYMLGEVDCSDIYGLFEVGITLVPSSKRNINTLDLPVTRSHKQGVPNGFTPVQGVQLAHQPLTTPQLLPYFADQCFPLQPFQ